MKHIPCADDDDFLGDAAQSRKVIRIHDAVIIESNLWAVCWSRATGDKYSLGSEFRLFAVALNFQYMRI
jgi:hypothetical protein